MKKKGISLLVLLAVFITASVTPVLAHGHGSQVKSTTQKYAVCSVADCTLVGVHKHNNKTCYGHYYNDGHSYHNENSHH